MSACVEGGASTTDGAIDPPADEVPGPQLAGAPAAVRRKPRTYASIARRCEAVVVARIARRAAGVLAWRNCCRTGTNNGSSITVEPPAPTSGPSHEGGMTNAAVLDDVPLTGGRRGAVAGFGSVATSTPLTPQTATAPTPLIALRARVLRVIARAS